MFLLRSLRFCINIKIKTVSPNNEITAMGIPKAKPNCTDLLESLETMPSIIPGSADGGDVEWPTNAEALVIVVDTDAEVEVEGDGEGEGLIEDSSVTEDLMVAIAVTKVVVI